MKGIRIREGLNQTEFAKLIGTTQANLSSMENGTRPIGKTKLRLLLKNLALIISISYKIFLKSVSRFITPHTPVMSYCFLVKKK
ncbi:helix-turn-helix domain-containing protein [Legionella sp. WA2022007384]